MIFGPDGQPVSSRSIRPSSSEHAFDVARRINYRGYFFFPTLEASEQMPAWTRDNVNRKVNYLYNNVPQVRMVIDGLTLDEVDTGIWPKASTSNPVFNKAVNDAFHEQNKDPRFFHASAVENFYSSQWLMRRTVRLFGEMFGQLLRPAENIGLPSVHFINTWHCGNANTEQDQSRWKEGMQTNSFLRPLRYRFLTNADRSQWSDAEAEDVMHFHDQFWQGQLRGMSGLTPIARKLFTFEDIDRSEANGLKLRNRQAYTLVRKEDVGDGPLFLPGAVAEAAEEIKSPDGKASVLLQKIRQRDGDEVEVATPPAGYEMKVLESNRPSQTVEFLKWILSALANTTLYPDSHVFSFAGLGQGTQVRMVNKRVQRVKNAVRQFQLVPQFIDPYYRFWLWQKIKMGAFDSVKGGIPADWWRYKVIYPPDDSVDLRGEGKMNDERVDTGKMSPSTYHGMAGEDDEDVEDEILAVRLRRLAKLKKLRDDNPDLADFITYESIFGSKKNSIFPETITTAPPAE